MIIKNITYSSFESPYKSLRYEIGVEAYVEEEEKGDTKRDYRVQFAVFAQRSVEWRRGGRRGMMAEEFPATFPHFLCVQNL